MKFYFKNVVVLLLIVGFLAPSLASAQSLIDTGNPIFDNTDTLQQLNQWSQTSKQNQQEAQQQLKQQYRDIDQDSRDCKPQQPGGGFASSLSNVIGRGIQQTLSQTLGRALGQNLQNLVQRQLGQVLPQVIQQGLSQQLPNLLRQQMRSQGLAQPTSEMMQAGVRQLLPGIIQNGLPSALQAGLAGSIQQNLTGQFQSQLFNRDTNQSTLLQNDSGFQDNLLQMFGPQSGMAQTLSSMPQLILQVIQNDIDENTPPSPQQLLAITKVIVNQVINQLVASVGQLVSNMMNQIQSGVGNGASIGLAKGNGMNAMVQRMMPMIMRVVLNGISGTQNRGIMANLNTQNFNSAIDQASGSFNNFNFNDFAGNNITAAIGFDLAPVSQAIAEPLAIATVSGLGVSGYDQAISNLASIGYQGEPTLEVMRAAGATDFSQLTPGGNLYLQSVGYQGLPSNDIIHAANIGDLSQAGVNAPMAIDAIDPSTNGLTFVQDQEPQLSGGLDGIGNDAASGVDSYSIADNVGSGFGQGLGPLGSLGSQIGGQLQAGLVSGLSSGVGNLVDGVPYVGGLLSPIAEQMVQTALVSVLGPIDSLGFEFQVNDPGTHQTIASVGKSTIKSLGKPLGKIQGFEQQQVKQNQDMLKQQAEELNRIYLDCMKNKAAMAVLRALEQHADVDNPAARERALQTVAKAGAQYQQTSQNAATTPLGDGSEGVSTTANPAKDQANGAKAGILVGASQLGQSNDPEMKQIANTLTRLALVGNAPAPTMSLSERQAFQTATNLPADQYFAQRQSYWAKNNPMSLRLDSFIYADDLANAGQAAERDKFLAYGRRSKEQCNGETKTIGGKQVCLGDTVTVVPGDTYRATDQAYATAPIIAGLNTQFYREDASLAPFFQSSSQWLTGSASQFGYGGGNPITINDIFNQGLNTAVTNGLNNAFSQIDNQLTSTISGHLQSGFASFSSSGGSFTAGSCGYTCNNDLHTIVGDSLGGVNQSQYPNLINILVEILVRLINNYR